MTQTSETKINTLHQIEQKFLAVTAEKETAETKIVTLRSQRASLFLEDSSGYSQEIDKLDEEIIKLSSFIDSFPSVIEELENQLTKEKCRLAQIERDKLLEQQQEVVDEIHLLSKNFINLISQANEVNINLRNALSAEAGIRNKTGQDLLAVYTDGSCDSLRMLLETCQVQMDGLHTTPLGRPEGNIQIRL